MNASPAKTFLSQRLPASIRNIRFVKSAEYFLQNHTKIFSLLLGFFASWAGYQEFQKDNFTVKSVTVPKILEEKGFNSLAVTDQLFEEIQKPSKRPKTMRIPL